MHKDLFLGSLSYSLYRLQPCEFLWGKNMEKMKERKRKRKGKTALWSFGKNSEGAL